MIPVAFYAPLKPPSHPNPSGDRQIARALIKALGHAGLRADLASDLRLLDIKGDPAVQQDLMARAADALPDLIARGRQAGWRLWVSYHNYYKAPDLLGPRVAEALSIPYVQIESTRAKKRLTGPWASFADAAERAADAAKVIFYFTRRDSEALHSFAPPSQTLEHLRPFLDRDDLPPASSRNGPALAVGMMRPGDKVESYRLIAGMLGHAPGTTRLDIVGDGKKRDVVEALMQPFAAQVRFLGKMQPDALEKVYSSASRFIWPGVNEAIGMVYLEAQAAGVPVLAQDRPGLRDVIAPGHVLPHPEEGALGLARGLAAPAPTAAALRDYIRSYHLRPAAAACLRRALEPLV
ncbi:glycosyltransferase [Aliishimia ponticola]|uniref:Glycosyltransferase n=1 Tax=Aliishimia ponticola TaxID=2499833 RepID=A0A4S4NAW7_9RHOB|nr:glycosyltransferase family 4 protein [Aliishimia ponticola]THH35111.1 glycosyltransferase [Aliishimia ponticola]